MRSLAVAAVVLAGCRSVGPAAPDPVVEPLSAVIFNGEISGHAADDAIGIVGTRIVALGSDAELLARCPDPVCLRVDAHRGFVMPGFHDAHAHMLTSGELAAQLKIPAAGLPAQQEAVRQYAAAHPEQPWIVGQGWNLLAFTDGGPTRLDLDAAEATRPVVLGDTSLHNVWANSAAIAAAGISAATPDPAGGSIVRDATGKPTGLFLDAAGALIRRNVPAFTDEELRAAIVSAQQLSLAHGFTATQGGPVSLREAKLYADLDREGRLPQRAFLWAPLPITDAAFAEWIAFAQALPATGRVQVVAFKGFVDGTTGASTAALLQPYSDNPMRNGELSIQPPQLEFLVDRANAAGFPVALHAIGDRAVRVALDAFEHARTIRKIPLPNRIEHASLIDPLDLPRFGALGVVASVQPIFLLGAGRVAAMRLGARADRLFATKSLHDAGAMVLFGTDFPVGAGEQDPITGMFCAIRRLRIDGTAFPGAEAVSGDSALEAFTANPATAIGWGAQLGKLEPGYEADVIVLDRDPRTGADRSLAQNGVRAVLVAGAVR